MSRKTYSPIWVMPSVAESETMGIPICCARTAAAEPSVSPIGPRMTMAPSFARSSTACAAPSGSPRVSLTETCTPLRFCRSMARASALRIWSLKALKSPVKGSAIPIRVGFTFADEEMAS